MKETWTKYFITCSIKDIFDGYATGYYDIYHIILMDITCIYMQFSKVMH